MIDTALGYLDLALRAIDNTALTIALLLLGAIFAAAGGMISARTRLYGALVGGMLINAFIKAEGGGFGAALAAMLVATGLGFALGSTPFLIQLLRRVRK